MTERNDRAIYVPMNKYLLDGAAAGAETALGVVLHPLPGTNSFTLAAFSSESTEFQSDEPVLAIGSC